MDPVDLLLSPVAHAHTTRHCEHRPWPIPRSPWIMAQTWVDLLFAHWEVRPEAVRDLVPKELQLDTFGGRAWIGITPFGVRNLRSRLTMPVPGLSAFPEINVRTYVTVGGRAGIYFFSLDAASSLAVAAARRLYRLPYFRNRARLRNEHGTVVYQGSRIDADALAPARFEARYGPIGQSRPGPPETLEHWLTERYCLYTLDDCRRPLRAEIHHPPWPLQPAWAQIDVNTMTAQLGIALPGEPLVHFARRQDVVFWLPSVAIPAD